MDFAPSVLWRNNWHRATAIRMAVLKAKRKNVPFADPRFCDARFSGLNIHSNGIAILIRHRGPAVRNDFFNPVNAVKRNNFFDNSERAFRQFTIRAMKYVAAVFGKCFYGGFQRSVVANFVE